ncbi:MAG: hypothetical protein IIB00_07505 [candidate division Zixibacteria bacterium]|nr:hypothetical protein [candidate division Zixibacteria bacterium]
MARFATFLVSALAILATIVSCGDDSVVSPPAIIPVSVAFGDSATVLHQGASLTFTGVAHDSRCQLDFPCVWEGMAEIVITLRRSASTAEHQVRLPILRGANPTNPETLMPVDTLGFRITLLELTPHPAPTNDSEYVALIELYNSSPDPLDGRLIISSIPLQSIRLHSFTLDTAYIESDRIHLTATYSGGCQKHYFWLHMSPPGFAESNPVQANFYLRHWSYVDLCDAIISEDLTFDLGPMIELYGSNDDDIIVNMHHYADTLPADITVLRYYGAGPL